MNGIVFKLEGKSNITRYSIVIANGCYSDQVPWFVTQTCNRELLEYGKYIFKTRFLGLIFIDAKALNRYIFASSEARVLILVSSDR